MSKETRSDFRQGRSKDDSISYIYFRNSKCCVKCEGKGFYETYISGQCKWCRGTGHLEVVFLQLVCDQCNGEGRVYVKERHPCTYCTGKVYTKNK